MITNQEFFDKTIRHFVTQGYQSTGLEGICLYRDPNGGSCAAGCHIPDDLYDPAMEENAIHAVLSTYPKLRNYIPDEYLASALQDIHDDRLNWDCPKHMVINLQEIAEEYGLNTTVLDSLDFSGIRVAK